MKDKDHRNDKTRERDEITRIGDDYDVGPEPQKGIEHRHDKFLPIPSIIGGFTVAMGLEAVLPGAGIAKSLKVLAGGASAGVLSYFANKSLFHTGSKLAASGDQFTILVASMWFVLMGGVFGTISFTGVTFEIVEGAKLREPLVHISDAGRRAGGSAADAKRIVQLISTARADKLAIAECEAQSGCVSGRPGRGPQVAALEALAQKFGNVEKLYAQADRKRAALSKKMETLASKYEAQLASGGVSGKNRAALVKIHSEAQSLSTELVTLMPTTAVQGLVGDLRRMKVAPPKRGRIDLGARLRGHADQLEEALDGLETASVKLPPFPSPSGIAAGWDRLDLTWPLAVLLFGLELILILLWVLLVRDIAVRLKAMRRPRDFDDDGGDDPPTSSGGSSGAAGRRVPLPRPEDRLIGRANGAAT